MATKEPVRIAPADGKLGVLLPGMGAVSTTFIAGVEAVKRGLAQPIGSLTQLATVRLGKRTEGPTPLIKDFVPLAESRRSRIRRLGHLRRQRLRSRAQGRGARPAMLEQRARAAGAAAADGGRVRPQLRAAHPRPQCERSPHQDGQGRDVDGRHPAVPGAYRGRAQRDGLVRLDRGVQSPRAGPSERSRSSKRAGRRTIPTSRPARFTPTPR